MCSISAGKNSFALVALLFAMLSPCGVFAAGFGVIKSGKIKHKNDVVIMENGDRNTGEIKKMEFGVLYLKSDRVADTMKLDWVRVLKLESIARYEFETREKELWIGTPAANLTSEVPAGEMEIVQDDGSIKSLKIAEIIGIHEMGRSTLSKINLSLDGGASFTSANKRAQSNFNLSTSFRRPKHSVSINVSTLFASEPDTTETARHELQIQGTHNLTKKWDAILLGALLHDSQQELQLRTTAGGGIQRAFLETNRTLFYGFGGAVYTNENYFGEGNSDRNNAEALAGFGFSTYRFRGSSLNTSVLIFPSLSDPGRVRIDTNFYWKWDIVRDLYWKISLTNNYDNRPPPNGINNNLSVTLTVGWSF